MMGFKIQALILFTTLSFLAHGQAGTIKIINNISDALFENRIIYQTKVGLDSSITYMLIDYVGLSDQRYKGLIIKDSTQVLLEWIEINNDTLQDLDPIDLKRKEWIRTCNQHNAEELVRNFYASDALYYNHKPLIQGTDAIIAEYSYMNNPNYSLNLVPLIVEAVNHNVVFEIGRCEGSYHGKYILIWEKNKNDSWLVKFDANL
ncbi:Cif family virulence factor [Portibacter lacus]|nr:hypothetical protein [Portibacter lacus]